MLAPARVRVALFATCLVDQFFAPAALAAAKLLHRLGCVVSVPRAQTCCGQPALNAGYRIEARRMAKHTLEVFAGTDYVVLPSGSCAAMLRRHYVELFAATGHGNDTAAGDDAASAAALAGRTFELSEFLVRVLRVTSVGEGLRGRRVAWHPGCHGLRDLGLSTEPLTLLRNAGAELVPWEATEECCGFGGLFSVKQPEVSAAMADRKLETLASNRPLPDVLTSADAGCLLQLGGRLKRQGSSLAVRHVAELLLEAAHG